MSNHLSTVDDQNQKSSAPGPHEEGNEDFRFIDDPHPVMSNVVILKTIFEHLSGIDLKTCRLVCKEWNALLLPIIRSKKILKTIFQHLRGIDLKTCRLVCKEWNEVSLPIVRSNFQITIHTIVSWEHRPHNIENFVELISLNKLGIPFGRYNLGSFCTTDGVGQKFLELCGKTIKELTFLGHSFFNPIEIEDVSEILKSTPNLEFFQIPNYISSKSGNILKLFTDDDGAENSNTPKLNCLKKFYMPDEPMFGLMKEGVKFYSMLIEGITPMAPNISELGLLDMSWKDESTGVLHCMTLKMLSAIDKLQTLPPIQTLHIQNVNTAHLRLLQRMKGKQNGLNLKKLIYWILHEREPSVHPYELVTLFKHTLQHLYVQAKTVTSIYGCPCIPHLKTLHFQVSGHFDSRCFNLKKRFPILEKLIFAFEPLGGSENETYDELNEFFPSTDPCPTVKSFTLYQNHLKIHGFKQILNTFPNMNKLKLNILIMEGGEIVRQIWSQMTQLESLTIGGQVHGIKSSEEFDSLFTGIQTQDVIQEMNEEVKELEKMTQEHRSAFILKLRNKHCTLPSIANFKKLKSLELSVEGVWSDGVPWEYYKMTDLTGYLALYSMNHLTHLIVQKCRFTKDCCEVLRVEMGLESWTFRTSRGVKDEIIPSNLFPAGYEDTPPSLF